MAGGLTIKITKLVAAAVVAVICHDAAAAAESGDAPAVTVPRMSGDFVVSADGSYVETLHAESRANNDAAAIQEAQKSIGYVASMQKVEVLEAYTLEKDGSKIPVEPSAIYDQLPPGTPNLPMFTDIRQKTMIFPQFAAGDTAVFTLRITNQPYFPGQFWMLDVFPRAMAADDVRDTITAPKSMQLQIETHDLDFTRKEVGDNIVYSWRYANPTPVTDDIVLISPIERSPRFFASTLKDYAELGHLYAEAAAPSMAVTPMIRDLAGKITQGAKDRRDQVRLLYEWVSGHIRYVAEELGKGSLVPHGAETVITNGYGDCKDHVALLGALLKAQGIDSKAILINAHNEYEVPKVATFAAFNHVISWVPEFDLYMDSSLPVAPFGTLPVEEYGKPMVVASVDGAHLGTMPLVPAGLMSTSTTTVEAIDKDGVLTGTTTTHTTGPSSIPLRLATFGIQKLGPEKAASTILAATGYRDATGRLDAPPPLDLTPDYTITGTFRAGGWTDEVAGKQAFYLPGGMRLMGLSGDGVMGPFDPGKLKDSEPVPCFNARESERLSLTAPPGVHFTDTPKDLTVKTANIAFTAHWALSDNTMTVSRDFVGSIDQPFCTAEIRKANAAALKQISDSYSVNLSFTPDGSPPPPPPQTPQGDSDQSAMSPTQQEIATFNAASEAGNSADYNRQIKLLTSLLPVQQGKERFYSEIYVRRAYAYSILRQNEAALSDLGKALDLEPNNIEALSLRVSLYMRKGDNAHLLPDLNRLIAKTPWDEYYDMRGTVLVRLGQYDRAIDDFNVLLRKHPDNLMYLQLRGTAYAKTGHFDEAVADLRRAAAHDTTDVDLHSLLCEALARSAKPADAIPKCTLLLEYAPYLANVMNWRGYAYYRLGNFAKAEHDFAGAAQIYPAEAIYLFERGAAKIRTGDRAGGEKDIAAAKHMSPAVSQKMAALKIAA